MTDPKQPLYDILGEAFKAGRDQEHSWCTTGVEGETAASLLFPLAARMEEIIFGLYDPNVEAYETFNGSLMVRIVDEEAVLVHLTYDDAKYAKAIAFALNQFVRSLPSSPERET